MADTLNVAQILSVVGVWLVCNAWAFYKALRLHTKSRHEPLQFQITDIWAAMPGLVGAFYVILMQYTQRDSLRIPPVFGGLLVASQCAGVFFSVLKLSRMSTKNRSARTHRALTIFSGSVLSGACCIVMLFIGIFPLRPGICFDPMFLALVVYLFKMMIED